MKRTKPPFRADHVGSLLRPAALKEAREKRAKGEIMPAELKAIEDREIERVIKKQEEAGLQAVTDGEFRRSWWHLDFLWGLDGAEKNVMDSGIAFAAVTTRNEGVKVTGKLGCSSHPMIEHFKFVAAHTKHTPKITAPDSVKAGEWFDVTIESGVEKRHPSYQDHHVHWIALFKDDVELARAYLNPVHASPKVTFTIRLEDSCKLRAMEEPNHTAPWESSKGITVTK